MIGAASGATTPNVCTCAITSCLLFFSSSAAIFICSSSNSRCCFICSMAVSEMLRPSSFSAMASESQSLRHVPKRVYSRSRVSFQALRRV